MESDLANRINSRAYRLGIIGLGYVGLPLIDAFISAGFQCIGFDVDDSKVELLNSGKSYIKHVDSKKLNLGLRSNFLKQRRRWVDFVNLTPC